MMHPVFARVGRGPEYWRAWVGRLVATATRQRRIVSNAQNDGLQRATSDVSWCGVRRQNVLAPRLDRHGRTDSRSSANLWAGAERASPGRA
ncbi:hypothetical protein BD309DRAFT_958620, partial [Dichomitus squalens]